MKKKEVNYLNINRDAWNKRTRVHLESAFYDNESFIKGRNSLNQIELDLLGDIKGRSILHLQCHFGQDTVSLSRLGARVTGVDLSDASIRAAIDLNEQTGQDCRFICCDVYSLPDHLDETFDMVFSSYGTIGWLPDMRRWAKIVSRYLKPGGSFIFAEFHPFIWMFNNDFTELTFDYDAPDPIIEETTGTYGDPRSDIKTEYISWNHGLSTVIQSLLNEGLHLEVFREHDYSPYDCFQGTEEVEPGKFRITVLGSRVPMVYSLKMRKL